MLVSLAEMSLPKFRKNLEAEANTLGETEHFFSQEKSGGVCP
jgi:hypothetical protein